MKREQIIVGTLIAIATGVIAKTVQVIKKRKKEDVIELEVLNEETIEG